MNDKKDAEEVQEKEVADNRPRKLPRKIVIKPVLNGWRVKVGCQEVVFSDVAVLTNALERYLTNPEKAERELLDSAIYGKTISPPTGVENYLGWRVVSNQGS